MSKYNIWFNNWNDSNHAITCVGILQDESFNWNIDDTTGTCKINDNIQHHPHTNNKSNIPKLVWFDFVSVKTGNTSFLSEEK